MVQTEFSSTGGASRLGGSWVLRLLLNRDKKF